MQYKASNSFSGISRRNALKQLSLSPLQASLLLSFSAQVLPASNTKKKIIIIGGGITGISIAAKLYKSLASADITIIEYNPYAPSYTPALSLVATGIVNVKDILFTLDEKIPYGVKLLKSNVKNYYPKENKLLLENLKEVSYDQLVITSELETNYTSIEGLLSSKDKLLHQNGLHSLSSPKDALAMYTGIKKLLNTAKKHKDTKKLRALFTYPDTPLTYANAPQELMFLLHSYLLKFGLENKVEISFFTNQNTLIDIPQFEKTINIYFQERGFISHYQHKLMSIDAKNKVAIFEKSMHPENKVEKIETRYDFIHITPPMNISKNITNTDLLSKNTLLDLNTQTLQHKRFKNIWALGDSAISSTNTNAASLEEQTKVLSANIIASLEGKTNLPAQYNSYKSTILITGIGKALLIQHDDKKIVKTSIPLVQTKDRWIYWITKIYLFKAITVHKVMKGYL